MVLGSDQLFNLCATFWEVEWKAIKTYSVPCTSTHDWWWKTFQIISAIKTMSHYLTVGGSLAYECKGRSGGKVSKKRCKRLDSDTATLARSEFTRWLGSLPIDVFFLVFVYSCRLFPLLLCNHFIRTENGKLFSVYSKKKKRNYRRKHSQSVATDCVGSGPSNASESWLQAEGHLNLISSSSIKSLPAGGAMSTSRCLHPSPRWR